MATPEILDFDRLLAPIAGDHPAGVELKEDRALRSVYQAVKDARESARSIEKKIIDAKTVGDEPPSDRPDWNSVYQLGTEALAQHSKDLWIAAWVIEALARLHGFAGLRDGFRLVRELVEKYWEGIHPRPDEDGYATTMAQLTGLNGDESEGALIAPLDRIPITAAGELGALSHADYKAAVELDKADPDKRTERLERGAVSLEMFEKSVRHTPPEFFRGLVDDIQQAIDEFYRMGEALELRCGSSPSGYSAAPPTSAIRSALADIRDRVQSMTQHILGAAAEREEVEAASAAAGTPAGSPAGVGGAGKGMSRDAAFRQLLEVADFFSRTEPHSPVSYALKQAVRWGRMSLPELLVELVSDSGVREDLFRRMGLPQPEERPE